MHLVFLQIDGSSTFFTIYIWCSHFSAIQSLGLMSGQKFQKSKQTVSSAPDSASQERSTEPAFMIGCRLCHCCVTALIESRKKTFLYQSIRLDSSWNGSVYYIPLSDTNRELVKDQLSHFTLHRGAWGQTSRLPRWHLSQSLHCFLTVLVLGWLTLEVLNHELSLDGTLTRQAEAQRITECSHDDTVSSLKHNSLFLVCQCPPLSMLHHTSSHTPQIAWKCRGNTP